MGASNCEQCGTGGKTYYVDDKDWLCLKCFKDRKSKPIRFSSDKPNLP